MRSLTARAFFGLALLVLPLSMTIAAEAFVCAFDRYSDGEAIRSGSMSLTFVVDGAKAHLVGNLGTAEVTPFRNEDGGITFVEVAPSNNVQVTAIALDGTAVHSRHTMTVPTPEDSGLFASQYYGKCGVRR